MRRIVVVANAVAISFLTASCGQNSHVTRPDSAKSAVVDGQKVGTTGQPPANPGSNPTPVRPPSGPMSSPRPLPSQSVPAKPGPMTPPPVNPGPMTPPTPARPPAPTPGNCSIENVRKVFTSRKLTDQEKKQIELPYREGKQRNLDGAKKHENRGKKDKYRRYFQTYFAFDVRDADLPARSSIARVDRVAVRLPSEKLSHLWSQYDHTELFCFLDERICSGADLDFSALSRGEKPFNGKFWSGIDRVNNRHFVDQLHDAVLWHPGRTENDWHSAPELTLEWDRMLPDSHPFVANQLDLLYGRSKSMKFVVADDLHVSDRAELIVHLAVNKCVTPPAQPPVVTPPVQPPVTPQPR
jgi:hypothetical protein